MDYFPNGNLVITDTHVAFRNSQPRRCLPDECVQFCLYCLLWLPLSAYQYSPDKPRKLCLECMKLMHEGLIPAKVNGDWDRPITVLLRAREECDRWILYWQEQVSQSPLDKLMDYTRYLIVELGRKVAIEKKIAEKEDEAAEWKRLSEEEGP